MRWFAQRSELLPDVLLDICRTLQPVSGYGGIGFIESPWGPTASEYQPTVYHLAQRLPGLEPDYPAAHSICLPGVGGSKPGIKGGGWLTVLGDHFAAELAIPVRRPRAPLRSRAQRGLAAPLRRQVGHPERSRRSSTSNRARS